MISPGNAAARTELHRRAHQLLADGLETGERRVLGICGAPGAGKSTLAAQLQSELAQSYPGASVVLAMDGYHLAQSVLDRRGLADVKGAPETFDGRGFASMLHRLHAEQAQTLYAPCFHREIEDSVAGEIEVPPAVKLVIVEGNYLLLQSEPWLEVSSLLDESWFLDLPGELRRERLVRRHLSFGVDAETAKARATGNDENNARLIGATAGHADRLVRDGGFA